jgi:hypothetical protein
MKLALTFVTMAALAAPAHAGEIYRWIDGATVVYSDQPPQEGVIITAMPRREPPPVVTAPDAAPAEEPASAEPASPPPLEPQAVARARPATVEEVLALSGIRAELPDLARSLGAEYLPRRGQLGERDGERVAQIVARQFAPERMYAAVRDDFRRNVDARQLEAMAAWFRSPLAVRITALEVAAARPDAMPKIAAFVAGLKTSPPTVSRLELVQRFDWVMGASHDSTEVALAIAASVARATAAATPADRRARSGLVDRRVEEMRGQMGAAIAESVLGQMLYVYAPLSDAELKAYVDFLASPPGRAYGRIAHVALLRVVRDVADRTAIEILREVPPQRWATAQETAGRTPTR